VSPTALALVLVAALLHAGWNALTKRAKDPLAFLWSSMGVAAVGLAPIALVIWTREGFPAEGRPYAAGSVVVHALYFVALATSYRHADFSIVYPVARGLGVALTPLLALALFAEWISPLGAAGIALVVVGIGLSAGRASPDGPARSGRGVGWAVATGLLIGVYSILDSAGARRVHPVVYLCTLTLGSVMLCAPLVLRRRAALVAEWRHNWRTILLASTMNLSGYVLVLFAYRLSKTGYVVACRELSIAIAPLLGRVLLGETHVATRAAGTAVIVAGVVCVALAR
jgi:drug/metabolite transporter (DMT)-like permease